MEKNKLGTENVKSLLISLAIPAIIGQLVSLIYNIVDRIYIGRISDIGSTALTGVGVCAPLLIVISAFAVLVGIGGAPRASIKMGEDKKDEAEDILGNCFITLVLISAILTILFFIFNERLLILFGASEKTLPYALEYMNIYTVGIIFVSITIGLNPFITAQGFANISMMTISIGAILNIVLDPIFIYGLNMGVKGAALATTISQGVSAIFVMYFLCKRSNLRIKKKNFKLKKSIMIPVLFLGLSPFVMQITESFLMIAFNAQLQVYGGDLAVGAMTIATTAMNFIFLPLSGITQGAQPIMSYNYGAKNKERMKETFKYLVKAAMTYSVLFFLFIMICPRFFASLFTKDKELIEITVKGLRVYLAGAIAVGVQTSCQHTLLALGNAKTSLFLALLRKIVLLIPLIYILPRFFENKVFAVFVAEPIADILSAIVTATLFYRYFKKVLNEIS
ncbi:MATE family efflux transporter [Peptoniphilus stercorisuis]|uniref:Multidrug export protein MepA n=1 Tax=Peptoniphilus stercorisuis TaxID=1436965 RepID=A0ABS4KDF6_9FIRM|nr:MATE family efflux transporter [Peptoniphilus stercorisuis]MBP2025808.1 putative MATE family efflux protein [Peptoniphilus stercorisuis]